MGTCYILAPSRCDGSIEGSNGGQLAISHRIVETRLSPVQLTWEARESSTSRRPYLASPVVVCTVTVPDFGHVLFECVVPGVLVPSRGRRDGLRMWQGRRGLLCRSRLGRSLTTAFVRILRKLRGGKAELECEMGMFDPPWLCWALGVLTW